MAKADKLEIVGGTKAVKRGKRIGGDDLPTYKWETGNAIEGRLVSATKAQTRFGLRTRVVMQIADGETIGLWLPLRFATALVEEAKPGDRISIERILKTENGLTSVAGYEVWNLNA